MHADVGEGRLVSGVEIGGRLSTLVEDTIATDSESSPAESRRTWGSDSGAEITTITCAARSDADADLAERLSDALVGAILERSLFSAADRDAVTATLRTAREALVRLDEEHGLVVDGRPARTLVASSGGATVRGTVVGSTVVVVVGDHGPLTLTLTLTSS